MAGRSVFKLTRLFTNCTLNHLKPCVSVSQRGFKRHVSRTLRVLKERQEEYLENMDPKEKLELERRSKFSEWNYSSEIYAFGKRLQEDFLPELLVQAFTHRSYILQEELKLKEIGVEKTNVDLSDNEELVKEGEKIISDYTKRYVAYFFPRFPLEGINSICEYLESDEVLAYISENLGTKFLILSSDYPVEQATFSKTLKAIIGALCKSQDEKRANIFVRDFIITHLAGKEIHDFLKIDNPVEVLNCILKKDGRKECEPRIIGKSATETILANYHVGMYSDKQMMGHSSGETVDIAIEMAAVDALKRLFHTTDSHRPISYNLEELPAQVTNLKLSEWNLAAFEKK
ncbi:hypothetical protein RUM43_010033 [Polyplax serrata]|uniref:Large ribosomal subunit protein mL44 n=1 Tax=Polyplax serrata TaxID=468196 RepID=A0AAN8S7U0_POLSC